MAAHLKFYAPKELPLPVGKARRYAVAQSIGVRIGRKLFVSEAALERYLADGGDHAVAAKARTTPRKP